ncbi:MAG: hypothetical protein HGB10_06575 [Coriobacteriia bacterium]|nr:hypothetical protein [Coriobacteriia bacterium]
MKRLVLSILVAVAILAASASPAFAAVKVRSRARAQSGKIVFTAKLLHGSHVRRGKVRIAIYRSGHVVRRLTAKRSGTRYIATWNLKTSSGARASAGRVTYRVVARTARTGKGSTRGTVVVPPSVVATTPPAVVPTETVPAENPTDTVVPTETVPVVDPTGTVVPTVTVPPVVTTTTVPATVTPEPTGRWIGFFQPGCPSSLTPLLTLEDLVGRKSAVVHWYINDATSFPLTQVRRVAEHGSTPMITLEFWSVQTGGVAKIINGDKDAYLNAFADAAKAYGGEVWIRPLHEMNGNWYPWSGTTNGNTPAQVVAAWQHIHDVFAARGADNVKFVWCVNNDSVPNTTANGIDKYYPGDAYVDYVSIDAYNWGVSASWSSWSSFSTIIGSSYAKVTALTGKPLFLAEIGCPEEGGSKAAWVADMFSKIKTRYTRIEGVCWFNVDSTSSLNADWRVESSSASAAAFKTALNTGF